ncbi:MAG: hypothetical protein ABMA01_11500 [Chthoniobacteraceae bacterium]
MTARLQELVAEAVRIEREISSQTDRLKAINALLVEVVREAAHEPARKSACAIPESSSPKRVAFSPAEFAALFGKSQTWGYRQIYAGKVTTITQHGRILIPAADVERILAEAGIYTGEKDDAGRVRKNSGVLDATRRGLKNGEGR